MNHATGITGRSDLAAVFVRSGAELASVAAELIGMEIRLDDTSATDQQNTGFTGNTSARSHESQVLPQQHPDLPLWFCVGRKVLQPLPQQDSEVAVHAWNVAESEQPASQQVAVPWKDLGPRIRSLVSDDVFSKRVDVDKLVDRIARLTPSSKVPFLKQRTWCQDLWIMADNSTRLAPFHFDMEAILAEVATIVPPGSMHVLRGSQPNALWLRKSIDQSGPADPFLEAPMAVALMILSDLGLYSADSTAWQGWLEWCLRMRKNDARLLVVFPGDVSRIPKPLRDLIHVISWIPPSHQIHDEARRESLVRDLFVLAAPTIRLEPGLLRDLRVLLPTAHDATLELDAWNSRLMSLHPIAATLDRHVVRTQLLSAFEELDPDLRLAVLEAIRDWRLHLRHAPEIWFEELMSLSVQTKALLPAEVDQARRSIRYYCKEQKIGSVRGQRCRNWMYNSTTRISDAAYGDPIVGRELRRARRELHEQPTELLHGTDLRELPTEELRTISLKVFGSLLRTFDPRGFGILPTDTPSGYDAQFRTNTVVITSQFEIKSSVEYLEIKELPDLQANGNEVSDPREFLPGNKGSMFLDVPSSGIAKGTLPSTCIRIISNLEELDLQRIPKPSWAVAWGMDVFGQYSDFEVPRRNGNGKVRQRMRWIPPGEFLMGSPDDEPGRYDDELQHHVTIASGFWMFDSPVTQDLYETIVGENPSYFRDPLRPVEQVDWDQSQSFAAALSERIPGLNFRLPTEAQWEYACRAGTTTAIYSGPMEIKGDRNAPALDPISWYGGNSGKEYDLEKSYEAQDWKDKQYQFDKAGSRRVKSKAANPWGLYDMLGNVWEWCSDWYASYYKEGDAVRGEKDLGSGRVVRGGSWIYFARGLRSACRYWIDPGFRYNSLGFRLLSLAEPEQAQDTSSTPIQ